MQREPFDRAFAGRNLEPLLRVVRGGQVETSDWMAGYDDGGIQVVMEGPKANSSDATDCGVLIPRPEGDWRADVEDLAKELGMQPVANPEVSTTAREARSWSSGGDRPLTLSYEVYREATVVRFARPATTGE